MQNYLLALVALLVVLYIQSRRMAGGIRNARDKTNQAEAKAEP